MRIVETNMSPDFFDALTWLFYRLRPKSPEGMVVFFADAGTPDSPNIVMQAGRFARGVLQEEPTEVIIAKEYVSDMMETFKKETEAQHD